jgi:hypothetical protein
MSIETLRASAAYLTSTVRRRNLIEYLAAAYVACRFGWIAGSAHATLVRAGAALVCAAALYVAFQLYQRGSARPIAPDLPADRLAAAYRSELCRQRDALRSVATWYIGPFIPGMALMLAGRVLERHDHGTGALPAGAVLVFVGAAVWYANAEAARRLQRRIDEIDGAEAHPG